MYQIKHQDKHQSIPRCYIAENYWDAIDLFDTLTKSHRFVQLWQGTTLVSEYNNQYVESNERSNHLRSYKHHRLCITCSSIHLSNLLRRIKWKSNTCGKPTL